MAKSKHIGARTDEVLELYNRAAGAILKRKGSTAVGHMQKALRTLEKENWTLDQNFYLTMLFSWADLFWSLNRPDLVLTVFDLYEKESPGDPHIALQRAIAFFHLARFDEAQSILLDLEDRGYPAADLHFFLGCLAERVSREATAMSHFERAAMLEPERYSVPLKGDEKALKTVVKRLLGRVGEPLSASLSRVRLIVEPFPSDAQLTEVTPRVDPLALTMVEPAASKKSKEAPAIKSIHLYIRNIEKVAFSDEEVEQRLAESLTQELSEFFRDGREQVGDLIPQQKH